MIKNNKKICSKCKKELDVICFSKAKKSPDGLQDKCRKCQKNYHKKYYRENKVELLQQQKEYTKNHRKEHQKANRKYYHSHKKERRECHRKYYINHRKERAEYYKQHIEERKKYNKNWSKRHRTERNEYQRKHRKEGRKYHRIYRRNKYQTNIHFNIMCRLRARIWLALHGISKSAHTMELLGCKIEFFLMHLQFTAYFNGYENFNILELLGRKWHLDHIRPCIDFNLEKESEQRICFHWTNLQILSAEDNLRKSDK
jgi:hypothetical protein